MHKSPLGVMALTCAAASDVTAWCLLALVVGIAAQPKITGAVVVMREAVGFITFMLLAIRPLVLRLSRFDQQEALSSGTTSLVLVALLLSAWMTKLIVLYIGLDLGVISPNLFAMMVLMALVTTIATTPVLRRLTGPREAEAPAGKPAEPHSLTTIV